MAATMPAANGPAVLFTGGTNFDYLGLAFAGTNGSADESAYFHAIVPQGYTDDADFTIYIHWSNVTGGAAGEWVSWDVSYKGLGDDDVFDAALLGGPVTVMDAVTAAGDHQIAAASFSSPTLASGDHLVVKITRDYDEANGGTGLPEDATLLSLEFRED
jgi:hypothetical protein